LEISGGQLTAWRPSFQNGCVQPPSRPTKPGVSGGRH